MGPYPIELRTRVVGAVEQGELTIGEVAEVFSVGKTFVKKMLRLQRAGEDCVPPVSVLDFREGDATPGFTSALLFCYKPAASAAVGFDRKRINWQ